MAIAKFARQVKRSTGFLVKLSLVAILGLCFIFIWSVFAPTSTYVSSQRSTFGEISESISANGKVKDSNFGVKKVPESEKVKEKSNLGSGLEKDEILSNGSVPLGPVLAQKSGKKKDGSKLPNEVEKEKKEEGENMKVENEKNDEEEEESETEKDGENSGEEEIAVDKDLIDTLGVDLEVESDKPNGKGKKRKVMGPLFDAKAVYNWRLCHTRSKHNYIPCIDIESASGKIQSYRHHERSCPKVPLMCLVPLPREGYEEPVRWPESKLKIRYKNVAHPKLAQYIETHSWLVDSGEYLTFPKNQSQLKGGVSHYIDSIEEMVPDIEWGKNIRTILDIGCTDSSFGASLLDKDVFTLSLGLKDDLVDLAQVALERGFAAIVSPLETRRLPFPSGVFDTIHCGECSICWHSNGGNLLLEMNRVLRPGGYFILSSKQNSIEDEEAMTKLTASICWNIMADRTDDMSDVGIKIYQKPESNDIYNLRRKKIPPMCKENENPDAAWYVPMKSCLHSIPSSIEERGTEWPEVWPKRLQTFSDWMNNREQLTKDTEHWKAVVDKSYLTGVGIEWSTIRNAMDMKAINGGFAAALSQQNVWVLNVIPIHAPDTLPIIFERGLVGIYHDWCEPFGTYPRSYDLLHADHLFSMLKNRCKQPVSIVVEMDRLLRPGGWAIIREKVEILEPLEKIAKSLHWEIRMSYAQDKEGILCIQKTKWRP